MENQSLVSKLLDIQKLGLKYEKKSKSHYGKYLNLEDLLETLLPVCNDNDLVIYHFGKDGHWLTTVEDTKTNQQVQSSFLLPTGVDPQKMGSAITYAKRYNLASLFNIVSDEDNDADSVAGKKVNKTDNYTI